MAEYRNIVSFKPRGEGKPFAVQIGSAKMNDDGTIDLYFDALPTASKNRAGEIQTHARISLPREDTGQRGGGRSTARPTASRPRHDDLEDDIPFG